MTMSHRFRKKVVVYLLLRRVILQTIAALILFTKILDKRRGRKRLCSDEPRSFPLLMWTEIFGKDRDNGERAEDVLDAFTNLVKEDLAAGINTSEADCDMELDDEDGDGNSVCGGEATQVSSKNESKKRKFREADDDSQKLSELIGSIATNKNELKDISRFIGYEHGLGQKRETLFNLLSTVEGLTDVERYDLADIIGKDSDRLEVFNGLPVEHKGPYLKRLVQRIGG